MKIEVIVPVINAKMFPKLLETIAQNTVLPNGVLIIDNSSDHVAYDNAREYMNHVPNLGVGVPHCPLGVNQAWRWGFDATMSADVFTMLNDDVLLNQYFFEMLTEAFQRPEVMVACPNTIIPHHILGKVRRRGIPEDLEHVTPSPNRLHTLRHREGWAFSIRRDYLDSLPPIPDALTMFCGDDWLWHWSIQRHTPWHLMKDNLVFHWVGSSVRGLPDRRALMDREKKTLMRILREQYGYTGLYPTKTSPKRSNKNG